MREDRVSFDMLDGTASTPLVGKVSITPPLASGLAMGDLLLRPSKRSSSTLGEYRKWLQTHFCQNRTVFDRSLPLAPDRASKPPTSSSLANKKRVYSLLFGTAARDPGLRR
jgi:hypothetical protein